jgi:hypothetical protein
MSRVMTAGPSLASALVPAFVKAAVRTHRVADALFVFALVILPIVGMIALLFLLSSTDPTTAVPLDALDGAGMLILPPGDADELISWVEVKARARLATLYRWLDG